MSDLANFRLDFTPDETLSSSVAPPKDWRRYDQAITTAAANVMKPDQTTLDRLLKGVVLRIPEYQRSYSWEEQNWEPLWNEIIAVSQAKVGKGRKGQDIFFGILFIAESDQAGIDYDIIDGQQRLTTIGLIIRALRSRMEDIPVESIGAASCRKYQKAFFTKADHYLFRDAGEFGAPAARLVLDEINRREYSLLISDDDNRLPILKEFRRAHGNARRNAMRAGRLRDLLGAKFDIPEDVPPNLRVPESSKLLLNGYNFFCRRIDHELEGLNADQRVRLLANLLDYIMHCLSVTVFRLGRDNPELLMDVFEVLNNRGMELALTDVVNARIVQRFSARDANDGEKRIHQWRKTMDQFGRHFESLRDFLIDYLTSNYPEKGSRTFHSDRLLEAFSHQLPPEDGRMHEDALLNEIATAELTLNRLEKFAPLYSYLIDASGETKDFGDERLNERIQDSLRRLQALQTRQWRALILACAADVEASPTKKLASWLADLIDAVERLAIRQSVCGVNPNRLEEVFRRAIQRFKDTGFDPEMIAQLWSDFRSVYGTVVDQESFVEALTRKEDWGNSLAKVVLWRTYAAQHAGDEMVIKKLISSEIHLEHVIPQAPYFEGASEQPWLDGIFAGNERYLAASHSISRDEGRRDAFLEELVPLIVKDIGNLVLLKDSVNSSIKNSSLAWKLVAYEATPGFKEILVNEPFSDWVWDEEQHELQDLIERFLNFKEGNWGAERIRGEFSSVDEEMDSLRLEIENHPARLAVAASWTADRLAERRASILKRSIQNLQLPGEDLSSRFSESDAKNAIKARIEVLTSRLEAALTD